MKKIITTILLIQSAVCFSQAVSTSFDLSRAQSSIANIRSNIHSNRITNSVKINPEGAVIKSASYQEIGYVGNKRTTFTNFGVCLSKQGSPGTYVPYLTTTIQICPANTYYLNIHRTSEALSVN